MANRLRDRFVLLFSLLASPGCAEQTSLTARFDTLEYCSSDDLTVLRGVVSISVENKAAQPLIVSRILAFSGWENYSETTGRRQRRKWAVRPDTIFASASDQAEPPVSLFAVARSGERAAIGSVEFLQVYSTANSVDPSVLPVGVNRLSLRINTWPDSLALGNRLRAKWRSTGNLLLQPMLTQPIHIELKPPSQLAECQGPPRLIRKSRLRNAALP